FHVLLWRHVSAAGSHGRRSRFQWTVLRRLQRLLPHEWKLPRLRSSDSAGCERGRQRSKVAVVQIKKAESTERDLASMRQAQAPTPGPVSFRAEIVRNRGPPGWILAQPRYGIFPCLGATASGNTKELSRGRSNMKRFAFLISAIACL